MELVVLDYLDMKSVASGLLFDLYGGQVEEKGYAVVVVAEGAGEELLGENTTKDASG